MISVIIPCYNAEKYIGEAIDSVLSQSKKVDEIVVVDDCSTDNTVSILRNYPVKVLSTEKNSGHALARNIGIAAVRGDLIAWLDADDVWDPDHCETVIGLLERHPSADVAFSGVRFFGSRSGTWYFSEAEDQPLNMFNYCFERTIVPANSVITRAAAVKKLGGFNKDIRIAPDFDFWLRFSVRSLFVNTKKITVSYRWHDNQISKDPFAQFESLYKSRIKFIEKNGNNVDVGSVNVNVVDLFVRILNKDLISSWYSRDLRKFSYLINISKYMGVYKDIVFKYRLYKNIPKKLIKLYDGYFS
ncbi:glycosyltransferase family 2 protein [Geoalkalibacter sp.]|uniref:glycosyltransferase family 2 protein n=1 Tax=Geoalkalibacter sp. TaxID=3041440 RepID=UPI00272E0863|nr:glycosyltransferase family 2 protein [Geoalkalibacter sp.]